MAKKGLVAVGDGKGREGRLELLLQLVVLPLHLLQSLLEGLAGVVTGLRVGGLFLFPSTVGLLELGLG